MFETEVSFKSDCGILPYYNIITLYFLAEKKYQKKMSAIILSSAIKYFA